MSNLQPLTIVVDVPQDEDTAVEAAAAAAISGIQDAGVTVVAAALGSRSLMPSPTEKLRAAVDALADTAKGRPAAGELQAAVRAVDEAAQLVEASGVGSSAPVPAPAAGVADSVSLPEEPTTPPLPSA